MCHAEVSWQDSGEAHSPGSSPGSPVHRLSEAGEASAEVSPEANGVVSTRRRCVRLPADATGPKNKSRTKSHSLHWRKAEQACPQDILRGAANQTSGITMDQILNAKF